MRGKLYTAPQRHVFGRKRKTGSDEYAVRTDAGDSPAARIETQKTVDDDYVHV